MKLFMTSLCNARHPFTFLKLKDTLVLEIMKILNTIRKILGFFRGDKEHIKCQGLTSKQVLEVIRRPVTQNQGMSSPFSRTVREILGPTT